MFIEAMQKDKTDNYLLTTNIAIIAGYLFVFTMAPKTERLLKVLLLVAFILFTFSLISFIWFFPRYPRRERILEELRKKTVKKFTNRIAKFVEDIVEPYARLQVKDKYAHKFAAVKNEQDFLAVKEEIKKEAEDLKEGKASDMTSVSESEVTRYVVEGFLSHMTSESRDDYKKAFKEPLDEKLARAKLVLDRISFRVRRQIFIAGSVFLFFSILIKIITN